MTERPGSRIVYRFFSTSIGTPPYSEAEGKCLKCDSPVVPPVPHCHRCYCSFCGKSRDDVHVITGPTVSICNECVELCNNILAKKNSRATSVAATSTVRNIILTDLVLDYFFNPALGEEICAVSGSVYNDTRDKILHAMALTAVTSDGVVLPSLRVERFG